jgi:hypothetical protein
LIKITGIVPPSSAILHEQDAKPAIMRSGGEREPLAGPDSGPEPPFPLRLDGKVIKGFGRGSKEVSRFIHFNSLLSKAGKNGSQASSQDGDTTVQRTRSAAVKHAAILRHTVARSGHGHGTTHVVSRTSNPTPRIWKRLEANTTNLCHCSLPRAAS